MRDRDQRPGALAQRLAVEIHHAEFRRMNKLISGFAPVVVALSSSALAGAPSDLASDAAKGTFSREGETPAVLAHAAAFVDQTDVRKPVIFILTDMKLPVKKWTGDFDLLRAIGSMKFSGGAFYLNAEGKVFRCNNYVKGRQQSASGIFEMKLDAKAGKELTGTAGVPHATEKYTLDVTFHATLK